MYMSLAHAKIRSEVIPNVVGWYRQIVYDRLKKAAGCRFVCLVRRRESEDEFLTLSFWNSKEEMEEFTASVSYQEMMRDLASALPDSSEWEMKLSEDLTLQYTPVPQKPIVSSYNVAASMDGGVGLIASPLFVRIVSMDLDPSRAEEFRMLYQSEVLSTLRHVKGCRAVFLSESPSAYHCLSVTLWDSKSDADAYEKSGPFQDLVERVRPMFSGLAQWKMSRGADRKTVTTEDFRVDSYEVLSSDVIRGS